MISSILPCIPAFFNFDIINSLSTVSNAASKSMKARVAYNFPPFCFSLLFIIAFKTKMWLRVPL